MDAFLNGIKPDDLIWTRKGMTFFLGKVGEWEYRDSEEYKNEEIVNIRPYDFITVGDDTEVPGAVVTGFIKGPTVRRVRNRHALEYSRYLFARRKNQIIPVQERTIKEGILDLIGPEDLEDVVAVYLQRTKHVVVFPTTSKKSTPGVECYGVSVDDGQLVGWSVKSGGDEISESAFAKFPGRVYLFQIKEWRGTSPSNCVRLTVKEIKDFILSPENRLLMPKRIQYWIDYIDGM